MTIETNTVADWHEAITAVSPAVAQVVAAVLQQHAEELAAHFYQVMMADPEAAPFLSHDTVQSHLKPGIQRWMRVLFQGPGSDPKAVAALQRHVGDVHARADIPVGWFRVACACSKPASAPCWCSRSWIARGWSMRWATWVC